MLNLILIIVLAIFGGLAAGLILTKTIDDQHLVRNDVKPTLMKTFEEEHNENNRTYVTKI